MPNVSCHVARVPKYHHPEWSRNRKAQLERGFPQRKAAGWTNARRRGWHDGAVLPRWDQETDRAVRPHRTQGVTPVGAGAARIEGAHQQFLLVEHHRWI